MCSIMIGLFQWSTAVDLHPNPYHHHQADDTVTTTIHLQNILKFLVKESKVQWFIFKLVNQHCLYSSAALTGSYFVNPSCYQDNCKRSTSHYNSYNDQGRCVLYERRLVFWCLSFQDAAEHKANSYNIIWRMLLQQQHQLSEHGACQYPTVPRSLARVSVQPFTCMQLSHSTS